MVRKRRNGLLACVMALVMAASHALAGVRAAAPLDLDALERYPAYALDEETGRWRVQAYQADALLDRMWKYGSRYSADACVFFLAAEGDARTGVWSPVLRVYAMGTDAVSVRAVSLMADGVRMDLAASSHEVSNGRYGMECVTVPLNQEGWRFICALAGAQTAVVRLIGDGIYTTELDAAAEGERRRLEADSQRQLNSGIALLQELGVEEYALWDLSADAWECEYGFRPAATRAQPGAALGGVPLDDAMGMVVPDWTGDAAQAAQEALWQHGFFSGSVSRRFDDSAVAATLRAQKYLGRVETGCFDEALLNALGAEDAPEAAEEIELQAVGGAVQVGVERFWFAGGVSASANPDTLRSVANQDNLFLVADGAIKSLSTEQMHLFVEMEASVVCNGRYTYQAELALESSGGTALDTLLLPLAQARLIAYAEVPAALARDAEAEWSLRLTHNGESLTIELK